MRRTKSPFAFHCDVLRSEKKTSEYAVSEIVGTLLLIAIGISLVIVLAVVSITIPNVFFSSQSPSANIIGTVTDNGVILENHGGQPISIDSMIYIYFAETPYNTSIANVLDAKSKADGFWNIGERIVIPYSAIDLSEMQISIMIVDFKTNSLILRGILQSGSTMVLPFVQTLDADSLQPYSANLHLYYDFKGHIVTRDVRFMYIKSSVYQLNHSAVWSSTGWIPVASNSGTYAYALTGLEQNTQYLVLASIEYNKTGFPASKIIVNGSIVLFSTPQTAVGIWHFDEPSGLIALDSSPYGNNGVLNPYDVNTSPQRKTDHVVNNKSLFIDGIDDYIKINSSVSLNVTTQLGIEAWVKPRIEAQLMGSNLKQTDVTVFRNRNYSSYDPDIIKVNDYIFAIVSRNSSYKGYVITVNVSHDGDIKENATTSIVDLLYFEKSNCEKPRIIKVEGSSDVFAIVYRGQNGRLNITTLSIGADGTINKVLLSKLSIDINNSFTPKIIHTTGDMYAVSYTVLQTYLGMPRYVGKLLVIRISSLGAVSKVFYYNFGVSGLIYAVMQYPDIIHIADQNYSIVFQDSDTDASVRGVEILSDGTILPQANNDKFDNDNISNTPLKILQVYNNIYAILYGDKVGNIFNGGVVATVQINPDGTLNTSIMNLVVTAPAEIASFFDPDFIHVNGTIFAVVYDYANSWGYVKTIEIDNAGNINAHLADLQWKLQFDYVSSGVLYPRITQINATTNKFGIVYLKKITSVDYNDGAMVTVELLPTGLITQKLMDSVRLGAINFFMPTVCHVSADVYALVCQRWPSDSNITVRTFSITAGGAIGKYCIDSKTFNVKNISIVGTAGTAINIVHVNQSVYALVFYGQIRPSLIPSICLTTITIANNGSIGPTFLSWLNISKTSYFNYCTPGISWVTGDVFAVSYHAANATRSNFLSTVHITPAGILSYIDTMTYLGYVPIGTAEENAEIIPVSGSNNVVAMLYCYDYNPGAAHKGLAILMTISIQNDGHINQVPLKIFSFDSYGCSRPNMIHLNGSIYGIVYSNCVYISAANYRTYGYLRTVNISSNGTLIKNIDSAVFSLTGATSDVTTFQTLTNVYQNIYAIAFSTPNNPIGYQPRGCIGVLRVAPNGEIGRTEKNTIIDNQLFLYSKNCTGYPLIFSISDSRVAVVYRGNFEDGFIETFNMSRTPYKMSKRIIVSKLNSYLIAANETTATATIVTTGGNKTLNLPLHNGWNYLVLSYNHTKMKFSNNVTLNITLPCNFDIKTSAAQLIFGGFSGTYDEFVIHKSELTDAMVWTSFTRYVPT